MEKIQKNQFEKSAQISGSTICGVDEVGRGCLAGPVVTAAVILPATYKPENPPFIICDSKELTQKKRKALYSWIITHCHWSIGIIDHHSIDTYNIYQTTKRAMIRAINQLRCQNPHLNLALIDAMNLEVPGIEVFSAPKGEKWSDSIAAASIIAKVIRDQLMEQLDELVPGYHLNKHKGYATKLHRTCILESKKSIIHRKSFV